LRGAVSRVNAEIAPHVTAGISFAWSASPEAGAFLYHAPCAMEQVESRDGLDRHEFMNIHTSASPALIGTVRRFGPDGVLYEIIAILDNKLAMVRVIDTGEEAPYALDKIFADPTD
jgi:hypothetical protein